MRCSSQSLYEHRVPYLMYSVWENLKRLGYWGHFMSRGMVLSAFWAQDLTKRKSGKTDITIIITLSKARAKNLWPTEGMQPGDGVAQRGRDGVAQLYNPVMLQFHPLWALAPPTSCCSPLINFSFIWKMTPRPCSKVLTFEGIYQRSRSWDASIYS